MKLPLVKLSLVLNLLACLALVTTGCNRGPAMSQVHGTVLMKDGSVPKGGVRTVRLEPTKDSQAVIRKGASGDVKDDGSFDLYTQRPGDGVHHGEYTVTFAVWKGPMEPVSLIDGKYTNAQTSPYKLTVDGDKLDLKYQIEPLPQ
jgi:hypothetical protein